MPRFMLFVRATPSSETLRPNTSDMEAMGIFNASMKDAGILETAEGLLPSSRDSARVAFHNDAEPTVEKGPFPHNEIVSGWWIIRVESVEEAVEWARKVPTFKEGAVVEVRRIAATEDFGDEFTKELREKEAKMRE